MKKVIEKLVMVILGLVSGAYLLNLGAGFFAEIPDNFPLIGNLDEAAATALLLSVLSYFGLDATRFFRGRGKGGDDGKGGKGPVIEAETVEDDEKKD